MATSYTSLLGLALPLTGELSGTWGDTVNNSITSLLDTAVAGTTTLSTDGDVTLTTTTGASNQARQAILLCSGARTALRTITAPAQSKIYTVINSTTGGYSVKIVGAGPTTGVTIVAGESALVAWNGSDFIKISNTGGSASFTNVTVSGTTTLSGLTASTALALDASKNVVSVTNTGTGNNVLSASPTLTGTIGGASMTLSSLTNGRVTYAGASGLLQDSANLTFDGTTLTANALAITNGVTLSGGTANGVAYLNGSKVLTTGSALTFDGTSVELGYSVANTAITVYNGDAVNRQRIQLTMDGVNGVINVQRAAGTIPSLIFKQDSSEQMRLTSTGLGIGTSSPAYKLDIFSSSTNVVRWSASGTSKYGYLYNDGNGVGLFDAVSAGGNGLYVYTTNNTLWFNTNGTTKATLDSAGNLGIGTSSPGQKLDVVGNIRAAQTGATALVIANVNTPGTSYSSQFQLQIDGTYYGLVGAAGYAGLLTSGSAAGDMVLRTNSKKILFTTNDGTTTSLALDSSGNLGLGVTPSAWESSYKVLDIASGGAAVFGGTSFAGIANNSFVNSSFQEIYKTSNPALQYLQVVGQHRWYTAPSGTAGNAISFTQAMTLDASGNLGVGTTSPTARIHSNGTIQSVTGSTGIQIYGDGGTGYVNSIGAYPLVFQVNSTERARIDSNGNFLAGLTSPLYGTTNRVQISANGSATAIVSVSHGGLASQSGYMFWDGANLQLANNSASGALIFGTASAAERMRLDSSGNLGIGTSSPAQKLDVVGTIQSQYNAALNDATVGAYNFYNSNASAAANPIRASIVAGRENSAWGAYLDFYTSTGTSAQTSKMRLDTSGNLGLGVTPSAWSGYKASAVIHTNLFGASGGTGGVSNNAYFDGSVWRYIVSAQSTKFESGAGAYTWSTATSGTAGDAISFTQAMTLDASGNLLVGTTSSAIDASPGIKFNPAQSGANAPTLAVVTVASTNTTVSFSAYSTGASAYRFYVDNAGTIFATSTSISGISDATLKENVRDLETGLTEVMALRPRRFDWKNGDAQNVAGFVAQEVEQVLPELVTDYQYSEGVTKKSLKMGDILPTLVKAIQEQQAIIESLKARLDAANL